jgi:hypothetical protein
MESLDEPVKEKSEAIVSTRYRARFSAGKAHFDVRSVLRFVVDLGGQTLQAFAVLAFVSLCSTMRAFYFKSRLIW